MIVLFFVVADGEVMVVKGDPMEMAAAAAAAVAAVAEAEEAAAAEAGGRKVLKC